MVLDLSAGCDCCATSLKVGSRAVQLVTSLDEIVVPRICPRIFFSLLSLQLCWVVLGTALYHKITDSRRAVRL